MTHPACVARPRLAALLAAAGLLAAAPASAQYRTPTYDWSELRGLQPRPARSVRREERGFDADKAADIGSLSAVFGEGGAWLGMILGGSAGAGLCFAMRDRSNDEHEFLPGVECFGNDFIVYGSMLGSYAIGSRAVLSLAGRAGCDFNDARRRVLRGALFGTLPAVAWMIARPRLVTPGNIRLDWSRDVTVLVVGTPVLQAVGATIAASRCRHHS